MPKCNKEHMSRCSPLEFRLPFLGQTKWEFREGSPPFDRKAGRFQCLGEPHGAGGAQQQQLGSFWWLDGFVGIRWDSVVGWQIDVGVRLRYLSVSKNRGSPKSSTFDRVFHYKSSILGYPYFWKHPFECTVTWTCNFCQSPACKAQVQRASERQFWHWPGVKQKKLEKLPVVFFWGVGLFNWRVQ